MRDEQYIRFTPEYCDLYIYIYERNTIYRSGVVGGAITQEWEAS